MNDAETTKTSLPRP